MADIQNQPIRPEDVSEMAAYYRVDPQEESYLLWVVRQAVETPLPPNWTEAQDDTGRTVYINEVDNSQSELHPSDAYFVNLINKERSKGHAAAWGGAWMEFVDEVCMHTTLWTVHATLFLLYHYSFYSSFCQLTLQSGDPYYYNFLEGQASTTRPAVLLVAPAELEPLGGLDTASTLATAGSKAGKLKITQLEVLSFRSWWSEAGAYGLSKRNIDIYFNIKQGNFQVVLDNADKIYTISHIQVGKCVGG